MAMRWETEIETGRKRVHGRVLPVAISRCRPTAVRLHVVACVLRELREDDRCVCVCVRRWYGDILTVCTTSVAVPYIVDRSYRIIASPHRFCTADGLPSRKSCGCCSCR